jgi:fibronectin type 3 domain-containing protein
VEPADTFPPPPPENLTLVASEGTISLIWNPSSGGDVAGYLVLRGEAPGDKLQALTAAPVTETTYRDTRVTSGVAYVYAVVAVDRAGNVGAQSTRVEERGR